MNPRNTKARAERALAIPLAFCLALGSGIASAAPTASPIIIGQSVAVSAGSDGGATRLIDGAKAYIGRINARGGINGRRLELVTLDDRNDPVQYVRNVRELVEQHRAVAIIDCSGDAVCTAGAGVATELRVPLVGALAGTKAMARNGRDYVFPIRPGYEREADAMARQLHTMGITKVVALTEREAGNERLQALTAALAQRKLQLRVLQVDRFKPASLQAAMQDIAGTPCQAAVMDLSPEAIDAFAELGLHQRPEWPRMLTSFANSSLISLSSVFKERVIGFTFVVPNPEVQALRLTMELQADAEQYSTGHAISFEGYEAYITTRVVVEAIRRAGNGADAERVAAALRGMDAYDLGGFKVSFAKGRGTGSDWLDVGLRSRQGYYLK
jgi:ABC-type branched-subunit amino acid transport system substrate-binding protein